MSKSGLPAVVGVLLAILLGAGAALAQDTVQVGYVILTIDGPDQCDVRAFETFGLQRGGETTQAFYVSTNANLSRDLGLAIVNPGNSAANLVLTLQNDTGKVVATKALTLNARQQTSQYISQLFSNRPEIADFNGTVIIESSTPVSMVGLRFRGQNFSTIPLINLGTASAVPVRETGIGGPSAAILPQFATGGGWASQIVLLNHDYSKPHVVRMDFFNQDGTPLTVTLNGQSGSSFRNLSVGALSAMSFSAGGSGNPF
jgi:hypothetical protein